MDQKHAGVGTGSDDHVISFGPFRFDRRGLHLSAHGKPVRVQPKALQVLRCLVARPREVVLKDEIMRLVWHDTIVSEGALAEAIHVLRQALGDDPRAPEFIETVHTRGYRFIGDVVSGDGGSEGAARRTEPTVAAPARAVVPAATTTFRGIGGALLLAVIGVAIAVAVIQAITRRDPDAPARDFDAGAVAGDPVPDAHLYVGLAVAMPHGASVYRYRVPQEGEVELDATLGYPWFRLPFAFAFDAAGEMFISDHGAPGVFRFLDPLRTPLFNGTDLQNEVVGPRWMIFRDRELFVGDGQSVVRRFTFDDARKLVSDGAIIDLGDSGARGIALHPETGELFVSLCCTENRIERFLFDASGNAVPNGAITGGDMQSPHDMTFSPWGELFVVNWDSASVSRFVFDAAGNASAKAPITGGSLNFPLGLDFSPWGELFVGNRFGKQTGVSRWTFDESFNAIHNGTFPTPAEISDVQFVPTRVEVAIDVEPGRDGGVILAGLDGEVAVAIMSNDAFDATLVDPLSVILVSGIARVKGRGVPGVEQRDLNGDGLTDIVVRVTTETERQSTADAEIVVTGATVDGIGFRGTDTVRVQRHQGSAQHGG